MKNMTIRAKLVFLTGITVFLILINGGSLYYAINRLSNLFEARNSMHTIAELTLNLRKSEKDYLLRDVINEAYFKSTKSDNIESFNKDMQAIYAEIESDLKNDFFIDNNLSSELEQLKGYFNSYHKSFDEIEKAIFSKGYLDYGIEGEYRKAVRKLEENNRLNGQYLIHLLKLRKHEKDFIIRKELTYNDQFNKEISALIQTLQGDKSIPDVEKNEFLKDFNDYKNGFQKAVEIQTTIGLTEETGLLNDLRSEIHKVSPGVESIIVHVNEAVDSSKSRLMVFVTITILLGLIFIVAMIGYIVNSITDSLKKANYVVDKISKGDLTVDIHIESRDEIGNMLLNLKAMTIKLKEIIGEILSGSTTISSASAMISSTAQELSQGASEQASSVEEVSSSMEEMTSNIQQNSDNSQQTDKIATKAVEEILNGSKAVNETVISMRTIAEKISIISEIAFQTNILALNAAVEAARAGDHGRGFAVVAVEVRKLAERSQLAAKEIDALTNSSVMIAEQTGKLFIDIVPSMQNTAKLVREITLSSEEQNNGANQVNIAIQQLNMATQQSAAASEELATSAEEMTSQAEQLQEIVSYFKVDTEFKSIQPKPLKKQQTNYSYSNYKQEKKAGINLHLNDKIDDDFDSF